MIIPKKILDDFEKFCEKNNITGKEKEEKFEQLKKSMHKSVYEPGEAVGIVAAQSISEPATQMTMRSYILATQRDRLSKVTQGLPRLIEIFDVRKTFEKNTIIYLKPEYNTKEKAREVANKIKEDKVEDIIISDSIDLINMRLEFELKDEKDREKIESMVAKHIKADVTYRGNKVFIKPKKDDIKLLRKIRGKVMKAHVGGIKGIEEVVVAKDDEEWIIQTAGTNIKKILRLDEIDPQRTTTNDVHQVFEVMGVEAARNVILQEAKDALDEQGLDVDVRHLILLADAMTADGDVKAVGRYGVSGSKVSVLARANFEETKKHIVNASFYGEKDEFDGVIENVLIGQLVPVGTGMVELAVDVEKMKSSIKPKKGSDE